ncbi:MAG: hypothetical protein SFV15_22175 [Polyangiaceae bacterium]|nr:hypothetical protein [Polyangiaceae bacterium]
MRMPKIAKGFMGFAFLMTLLVLPQRARAQGFPQIQTNCATTPPPYDYGGLNQVTTPVFADSRNANSNGTAPWSEWWTYADPSINDSTNCTQFNVGLVWGAPNTGKDVKVQTWWYDEKWPPAWTRQYCPALVDGNNGHFHTATYLFGWRWNGSMWAWSYYNSYGESPVWNVSMNRCEFSTDPAKTGLPAAYNWGTNPIVKSKYNNTLNWLLILSQGTTHVGNIGCGYHGCYGRVLTQTSYN